MCHYAAEWGEAMSKMTFVVDFPDGQEPPVSAGIRILGGKLVSVAFKDISEGYDLIKVARLGLQCGIDWSRILRHLVRDHGWDYRNTGTHSGVVTVPSDRVDDVRALVRDIVPAVMNIRVLPEVPEDENE
jgi:hypothetical protein